MKQFSFILPIILLVFVSWEANSQINFKKLASPYSVEETVSNLNLKLTEKNMNIFAVIDHQQGAAKVGLELRPNTLVIFGNPEVGTKLMQCDQRMGYDLPLKMLIWEDENGATWIGYWDSDNFKNEYQLEPCNEVLVNIKNALGHFAKSAIL